MNRSRVLLGALAAESFMMTFDGAAVQITLPILMRRFGASLWSAQWTMTAFLLVSTAALLPAGRAGDVFGRDRVWRLGVLVFAAASLGCMAAPTLGMLIAARAAQGLGAALATANAAPLLVEAFPGRSGRALAVGNIAIALGLVAGPALGSLLAELISWRAIFAVAVPIGAVVWWLSPRVLPRSRRRRRSLDWVGGGFAALALGGIVLGMSSLYRRGAAWSGTNVALAVGVVGLGMFIAREALAREPLLAGRLFKRATFSSSVGALLLGSTGLFTLTVAMPYYFISVEKRPVTEAGLLVGAMAVGLIVAAPLAGRAFDRLGSRPFAAGGLATVAAALALLFAVVPAAHGWQCALGLFLAGAGLGAFESPNTAAALGALPSDDRGVGMATITAVRNFAMTVGVAVSATLIDHSLQHGRAPVVGVRHSLAAGALAAGAGALVALARPKRAGKAA